MTARAWFVVCWIGVSACDGATDPDGGVVVLPDGRVVAVDGGVTLLPDGRVVPAPPDAAPAPRLVIDPPAVAFAFVNQIADPATATFTAYWDRGGARTPATDVSWEFDRSDLGAIDTGGVLTPLPAAGVATVTATSGEDRATAQVTSTYRRDSDGDGVVLTPEERDMLAAPVLAPDAASTWSYPYESMVYPRGVGPPVGMLTSSVAGVLRIELTSERVHVVRFVQVPAGNSQILFTEWPLFEAATAEDSALTLRITRLAGGVANEIVVQHWTLDDARIAGSIYSYDGPAGRITRIPIGATEPDDFLPALGFAGQTAYQWPSADGTRLVFVEFATDRVHSLDLATGTVDTSAPTGQWGFYPGVSPDGRTLLNQNLTGAFDLRSGAAIEGALPMGRWPTFAPGGGSIAFLGNDGIHTAAWDPVGRAVSGDVLTVPVASVTASTFVSLALTADGRGLAYLVAPGGDSAPSGTIAWTDGDEPTVLDATAAFPRGAVLGSVGFAPQAFGDREWLLVWGNLPYGFAPARSGLWIAAVDRSSEPGTAPRVHPVFYLNGQSAGQRGGSWVASPPSP